VTPRLSVLVPGEPGDRATRRTVASVRSQGVPEVEVVLGSPGPDGTTALETARRAATGDLVGVLAPGDELEPGALRGVLTMLAHDPGLDVLYTDEQWPAPGAEGIATKPDWAPHYLAGYPYLGRLTLVRAGLLERAGGFRAGFEGAEEWDAHLRATELTTRIAHLPAVLVTRAEPPRTDAAAVAAGTRALEDRVRRSGRPGRVEATAVPMGFRTWWEVAEPPLVSVVMPTAGGRRTVRGAETLLVEQAARSLVERTTYPRWELVLVTSEHTPDDVVPRVRDVVGDRLVEAPIPGAFNFSASVNEGARLAGGTHLLLLNDDTEAIEPRWLDRMVSVAAGDGVGAVGAKLLFEEGTIQHVGIIVDDKRTPIHALGSEADGLGRFGTKELDMDFLAVTGACLLTPADVFAEVGGFTTELPLNFNDVDYCLKVVASGRSVVTTPFARLFHFESSTRGHRLEQWEQDFLDRHWGVRLCLDPHVEYRSLL
jgi:hypothetical protein